MVTGGGGFGAEAMATVANGEVTGITIVNVGSGYTSTPFIRIASPPFAPSLSVGYSRVNVTMSVVLGRRYQLESSADLLSWAPAGDPFLAEDELLEQEFILSESGKYFRITELP